MGWLAGWSHRKTVTITGQSGAGTNYQVNLSIGDASGGDFHLENHCTSFPNDITVTDNDQITLLDHWVEDLTVDPISMWVEVADDLGSNADVCVYYTKSGESSASNITNTWIFSSDAEEATDLNDWPVASDTQIERSTDQAKTGSYSFMADAVKQASEHALTESTDKRVLAWYYDVAGNEDGRLTIGASDGTTACLIMYEGQESTTHYVYRIGVTYYTSAVARGTNAWHLFEWRFKTGNVKGFIDGTEIFSVSEPDTVTKLTIGTYWTPLPHNFYGDNICVGKYNDPEPAFSSAGSEESAGGRLVYGGLVNAGLVGGRLA